MHNIAESCILDAENFLPAYKEESDNMKKKCIMALIIGAAFLAQGCGYEEGTDAVVTVVDSTPTPEPTEKPKATATPTPEAAAADSTADGTAAAADSTADGAAAATDPAAQTAATEQTPSGINVQAQDADARISQLMNESRWFDLAQELKTNAEAEFVAGVLSGESLKCTGVCDNGWIRVDYNGQTCYASGDYVSTTPPVGAVAADTTAEDTTTEAAQ